MILTSGTNHGPPKVVAVIPLSNLADAAGCVAACLSSATWSAAPAGAPLSERVYASFLNNKARMCFLPCGLDLVRTLEAAKCADMIVFVASALSEKHSIVDGV